MVTVAFGGLPFAGHKESSGCTGKRNRAAYVPMDNYSERTLASDFGLLEEAVRLLNVPPRT